MALVKCPTCGKPFETATSPAMPFCSSRCRQIDLNRWLSEDIAIPVEESDDAPPRERDHDDD